MQPSNTITLKRTNNNNPDFLSLIKLLDADLALRDGDLSPIYFKYNQLQHLDTVVLAYIGNAPVGCGCFKAVDDTSVEIKRMFVKPGERGKGIATIILKELETWAAELGFVNAVLETGKKNPEAVAMYKKQGYTIINNYGPYINMPTSICFSKSL